jgi:hypothetical protein
MNSRRFKDVEHPYVQSSREIMMSRIASQIAGNANKTKPAVVVSTVNFKLTNDSSSGRNLAKMVKQEFGTCTGV